MQRIFFCNDSGFPYDGFCTGSGHPIEIDGRCWPTVEHYVQAQKFVQPELQELVRRVATAEQTRELGNSPCLPRRGDWATVREAVMQRALRAKFEQHPLLAEQLAATGHAELIYDAPEDAYWGAGPDRCGRNRLGVLLMRLRAELAASPARAVLQAA